MKLDEFGQPFNETFTARERISNALLGIKIRALGKKYYARG